MASYKGLSTLEVLEWAKEYNKWIASNFIPYISYPAIEIGAGRGNISEYFLQGSSFYITDVDKELVKLLKNKYKVKKKIEITDLDITKQVPIKLKKKFCSAIAINVLEHIEDDVKALFEMNKLLKTKGKLLLLVPAKKFAYTRLDTNLGHFRRYEKEDLVKKFSSAGFKILNMYYFNILGLLSWWVRDKFEKNRLQLNTHEINIFEKIVPVLKLIEGFIKPPVGISIIVIAQKL